jgi:glycosyltransferase involved in cell wall biosynthesis
MTDPTPERPLVTFALFAYNQEQYIREAVEGAFSQTYEPLEIILSDDCSTDRTFEIMQEMAAAYAGPHEVRVRQSEVNRGLIDHVFDVTEMLNGKIVIFAAGDDISRPGRTTNTVNTWDDQYHAIFSKCDLIDERGDVIRNDWIPDGNVNSRLPWLKVVSHPLFVYGASSAYRSDILRLLPRAEAKIFSEDTPLNLIIQLHYGKVGFCKESLVYYRVHGATLSNSLAIEPTAFAVCEHEKKRQAEIERSRDIIIYLRDKIILPMKAQNSVDQQAIDREIESYNIKLKWYKETPLVRFMMIFSAPKGTQKWLILRAMGPEVYSVIKSISLRSGFQRTVSKE